VSSQTLAGRRILVTRGAKQAPRLSDSLRALGAVPVEVPVIEIRPIAPTLGLDLALPQLDSYDWILFTSTNSVQIFVDRAVLLGISLSQLKAQVAAVGKATAQAAENAGLDVAVTPMEYVAENLISVLAERVAGKRVLLARAVIARDLIPDSLRALGSQVDVVNLYRNVLPEAAPMQLRAAVEQGIDAATFTSSSSVTHLAEAARAAGLSFPFLNVAAISIGPITSQTLRDLNWPPAAEATPHDIPGLIAAIFKVLGV